MISAPHVVSVADIQETLNKIWESFETTNTTRASLFNLIFYTEKKARAAYVQKLAQIVVEKFPSRVIFVLADKQTDNDFLKTEVNILSSSRGEYDVACDYIQFEAGGASQARIPFVILPHILPDLPIYLIWAEDPCVDDPLLYQLNRLSSRLIFDSETTKNLAPFSQSILRHHEAYGADIADLNWARIESWRDLLSMVFYSEENLARIARTQRIEISFNAQESTYFCHTRIQAIYLQAWIACQLGWEYEQVQMDDDKNLLFSYQSPYSSIEICLKALHDAKLPPGLIVTLDISTLDAYTFSFSRDKEQLHRITLNAHDHQKCDMPAHYVLQKAESGHSLVKEVTHRGTSKHFLKVLNLLKDVQLDALC